MAHVATTPTKPRLKVLFDDQVAAELKLELKLSNINEVPKLEKIIVSVGLGKSQGDKRVIEAATTTVSKVTGQKPIETKARKSIASFKLREGSVIGIKATLRGDRMYEFADRFINLVLPRLRDFHGVPNRSFDRQGNYSVGLIDQSVFPELSYEDTTVAHGLQVTFAVKSNSPEHTKALLEKFGLPFEKGTN